MTLDDYNNLLNTFDHRCYICGSKKKLCVDHDHKTGKIRGILCNDCNLALGYLRDNKRLMLRAIDYLTNLNKPNILKRWHNRLYHIIFTFRKKIKSYINERRLKRREKIKNNERYLWKIDNKNNIADWMWITLSEHKPEYDIRIDIMDSDGNVFINWYFTTNGWIEFFTIKRNHIIYIEDVVKWRPTIFK